MEKTTSTEAQTTLKNVLKELQIPEPVIDQVLALTTDEQTGIELALQYTEQYFANKTEGETGKGTESYPKNEVKMVCL